MGAICDFFVETETFVLFLACITVKNRLPVPLPLERGFEAFILPHLSMPKRGPKCKLGYYRVFNLILWVLYTGMQWKCLPVPTDPIGKPAISSTWII